MSMMMENQCDDVYMGVRRTQRNYRGLSEKTSHLGDPGIDGRIILRWMFRK